MAITEAETQHKHLSIQPLSEAEEAIVDYRVLETQLSNALQSNPEAADEIIASLQALNRQAPGEAIGAYGQLILSRQPNVIDVVSNQLADLLSSASLMAEQRQQVRDLWKALLHPIGEDEERAGDDCAYIAQEVYHLARKDFDSESQSQLDPEVWSEFLEPALQYLEVGEGAWALKQKQIIEIERRNRIEAQIRRQRQAEFIASLI